MINVLQFKGKVVKLKKGSRRKVYK